MSSSNQGQPDNTDPSGPQFTTTHWSVVLTAQKEDSPRAADALAQLCRTYWFPLYAHVRRRGQDHHSAEDLTQEFFTRLLEKRWLDNVAPEKGRFRTFLLAALDHFLANDWRKARTAKRGGGQTFLSLEETHSAEVRYAHEPSSDETPARAFDKSWALTVLEQALVQLQQEFSARGKAAQFDDWKVFLTREATNQDCQASGQRLGMNPGTVSVAVHRLRQRYGDLLRQIVAQTVSDMASVDEELRYLFAIVNE